MNEIGSREETIAEFQRTLMISPFHRWLELKAVTVTHEQVEIALPWREEFVANTAIEATHGGILAALIDLTGLYAVRAAGGIVSATADLRVDYHQPATRRTVIARGMVVKLGAPDKHCRRARDRYQPSSLSQWAGRISRTMRRERSFGQLHRTTLFSCQNV